MEIMVSCLFISVCSVLCVYPWFSSKIPYGPNMKGYNLFLTEFTMDNYGINIADSYVRIFVSTILLGYNVLVD